MCGWSRFAAASASARKRATSLSVAKVPREDHLEGDDPVQADLPGLVDDAHPAPGDLLQQLVVAEVADGRQVGMAVSLDRAGGVQLVGHPQGRGHAVHAVEVGEERPQPLGVLGVAVEQLLAVGHLAGLHGQHVGGDDRVERVCEIVGSCGVDMGRSRSPG